MRLSSTSILTAMFVAGLSTAALVHCSLQHKENSLAFGYVIAQISVTNSEVYAEYIKLVLPTIEHYGGEFLVRGGQSVSYEGEPPGDRNVVIRFPSYQAAHDWYHSEEYSKAKALRRSASTSVQTIVEGL